jgi:hypothetical protein
VERYDSREGGDRAAPGAAAENNAGSSCRDARLARGGAISQTSVRPQSPCTYEATGIPSAVHSEGDMGIFQTTLHSSHLMTFPPTCCAA